MTSSTKSHPLKLDGYVRVSRVGGRSGESFISPHVQREQIEAWAKSRGHEVIAWHEDLDQSGGTIDRPGFQAALARIEAGQTGGVIVAKLDRFARSVPRAWEAIERIQQAGGTFVSVADDLDLSTPSGRLMFNMLGSVAQFERDRISESWKTSNARAISRGVHFTSQVPLGYFKGDDGRLVIDPETSPLVQEVFRRRAQRDSWRQIADWLTARHPRTDGREWSPRNIATMVQRRTYLGEAFHGEYRNPDAHQPIVSPVEWAAANAVTGGPGAIHAQSSLLAGVIRCAGCRYAMRRAFTAYKDGRRVEFYSCQRRHTGGRCSAPAHVMAHTIEPLVVEHLLTWVGHASWAGQSSDLESVQAAQRQLDHAEARLETFLSDDRLREAVSEDAYYAEAKRRTEAVENARAELEAARTQLHVDEGRQYVLVSEWDGWDHAHRADLIRKSLDAVYVRKGRGAIEDRALFRWAGEDKWERPTRGGTCTYKSKPIPWPDFDLTLANVPEWAWRIGHHAIPEELRAQVQDMARALDAAHPFASE